MKHFKLRTDLVKDFKGTKVYQIESLIEGPWGPAGTLGGYVEKEDNLQGKVWVLENVTVYGNAWVSGGARVEVDVIFSGDVIVSGNAEVYRNAIVLGNATGAKGL